jgi:hypothetical protein
LKDVITGDTISDENKQILLESMDFPEPVISVAIEPKTKADQEKMGVALGKRPRKIRLSISTPTRTPIKRSFPAWANSIWRSSLTG